MSSNKPGIGRMVLETAHGFWRYIVNSTFFYNICSQHIKHYVTYPDSIAGGYGGYPFRQKLSPPWAPKIKWHFVQGSMESCHFESQSNPRPLAASHFESLAMPLPESFQCIGYVACRSGTWFIGLKIPII